MPTEPPTTEQLEEQLRVFGLKLGATLEEIKKRKGFMTKVMHEDIVAPQLKDQAHEEMIRINAAWEVINAWFKANRTRKQHPSTKAQKHLPVNKVRPLELMTTRTGSSLRKTRQGNGAEKA